VGSGADLHVRLVAPLTLMAHAVAAALRSRGIQVVSVSGLPTRVPHRSGRREILLLLEEVSNAAEFRRALGLIGSSRGPVLVLTSRDRGRFWGALLAAGADAVMPATSSLADVDAALRALHRGEEVFDPADRAGLVTDWERFQLEQRDMVSRLARLSPRERNVLDGLCGGSAVPELAEQLGVAETTVRSQVKSILRKLGVRSQLAAVAMVHRLENPLVTALTLVGLTGPHGYRGPPD
jgi:DNA-binding NarL/FixJ family response regulator